jgi:hypothetical protein
MGGLKGEKLLRAWELSRELPELEAVLAVLALARPGRAMSDWLSMPLGERNALLLELRAETLGRRMEAVAECPRCGSLLEFSLDVVKLKTQLQAQCAELLEGSAEAGVRTASTEDLIAARKAENDEQARAILQARTAGGDASTAALERVERMHAAAEISIELACMECRARAVMDLDIAHFFLREIAGAARRLMAEIHELAMAYGWSERAIANMSARRRAAYLEMVGA